MVSRHTWLFVIVVLIAVVAVSSTVYASVTGSAKSSTTVHTITVGGVKRSFEEIAPSSSLSKTAPIIVMLSGVGATVSLEITRDQLAPLAADGLAEVVYPVGIGNSWNVGGGCCGEAGRDNVNDVAFLQALVAQLDPQHVRPIDLVGYSNGGRLTYQIACTDPTLFNAFAVVKAMPQPGCIISRPVKILQVVSTNDPHIAYQPGDPGTEQPPATVEISRLRTTDGCTQPGTVVIHGSLALKTWHSCRQGSQLAFAVYVGGAHSWPEGNASTPSAATVIWSFLSGKSSLSKT